MTDDVLVLERKVQALKKEVGELRAENRKLKGELIESRRDKPTDATQVGFEEWR